MMHANCLSHKVSVCHCGKQAYAEMSSKTDIVMVSVEDRRYLDEYWWTIVRRGRLSYAHSATIAKYLGGSRLLHLRISGHRLANFLDRNGLNCMRENFRSASKKEILGTQIRKVHASIFRGVYIDKRTTLPKRWIAKCGPIWCGRYATKEDAARAYDEAARQHFGAFARLNFPNG